MRSTGPQWVALVLAVLAFAIITYIAMPPASAGTADIDRSPLEICL